MIRFICLYPCPRILLRTAPTPFVTGVLCSMSHRSIHHGIPWLSDCAGPVDWVRPVLHSNGSSIVIPFQSGNTCGCSGWGRARGSYSYKCMLYDAVVSVHSQPQSNRSGLQSVKNYEGTLRPYTSICTGKRRGCREPGLFRIHRSSWAESCLFKEVTPSHSGLSERR